MIDALKVSLAGNDTTARMRVGELLFISDQAYGERQFRYTKAAATLAAGDVVIPAGTTRWNVTNAITNADDGVCGVGVANAIVTSGSYGFTCVRGSYPTVKIASGDQSAALGKAIAPKKNTTGECIIIVAAATTTIVGQVAAKIGYCDLNGANPATTLSVVLNCP